MWSLSEFAVGANKDAVVALLAELVQGTFALIVEDPDATVSEEVLDEEG